ncbi:MAG: DNA gyrase subunit A, partial [Selenomonas sp.]|nr:DNA gyrase subunit A [Selenomonas sp.]
MATRKGIVKKTSLSEFSNLRKNGLNAINLDDDDDLMGVKFTDGESYLMLGTKLGKAIAFSEDDVRAMGRMARGVKGITLSDGDEVVGMDILVRNAEVLTVTECGYGKRTSTDEYRAQTRGGKGLINMKVTEKTGCVVGIKVVRPDHELMLITTDGIVIRTNVSDISVISRNTQGVKLMTTAENDKVASMATLEQKED